MSIWDKYKVDIPEGERGRWKIERFTVGRNIETLRAAWAGRAIDPGTYTRLLRGGRLVMSDTPAEIGDHIGFMRNAHGRILIHGLGLGMCLRAVLMNEKTDSVDVVEIDPDVIALVGPHYLKDSRVRIHEGDALTFRLEGEWDYAWHDIWDDICADNYDEMKRLHRRYGRRVANQESWCRYQVERAAKEEKRYYRYA